MTPTRQIALVKPPVRSIEIKTAGNNDIQNLATSGSLTTIYKIGVGDVLFVDLVNTAGASGYYTVRPDGTIDFPIAGNNLVVAGRSTISAGGMIARAINVYSNPRVEVKISQYGSHKVEVFGLVERSGEKSIQREAVPLFVIKAEAGVDPKATKVVIRRNGKSIADTFHLRDAATDEILVLPGDSVEFTAG